MELIATPLGDHHHLGSASNADAAARVVGFHLEFLDALYRRGDRALRPSAESAEIVRVAGDRNGDFTAIQQIGVLVAPRSRHLPAKTARLSSGRGLLRHG